MGSLAAVLLPVALLALLHSPMTTAENSNLFREYIGTMYNGVKFSDVPINPDVQFDFILAFVIDYTTSTRPPSPTNGRFQISWENTVLTPSAVAAIKRRNPNVRVAVSLGGAIVSHTHVVFTADSVDSWVQNAVDSLTGIIQKYGLDGIDIDYEKFHGDKATFAECIGQLVTTLKDNGVIQFASIAPFDDPPVQSHYKALWASYGDVIDYINFQFYGYNPSITADEYVSHFNDQLANYPGGNILASFSTEPDRPTSSIDTVLSACQTLQSQGNLYGIFIWAADYSKSQGFKSKNKKKEPRVQVRDASTGIGGQRQASLLCS